MPQRVPFVAVVEIAPAEAGALTERLRWAYRLSREGVVALALNGVDIPRVNRMLDEIVGLEGIAVSGVLYLSVSDEAAIRDAIGRASTIWPVTEHFSTRFMSGSPGLVADARLAAGRGASKPPLAAAHVQ